MLPNIKDFELNLIEDELDVKFSENFRNVLKIYGGTSIAEKYFEDKNNLEWELSQFSKFDIMHGLTKEFKESGWGLKVPFAYDPGGWHYCLSFDPETKGKIIVNRWTDHGPEEQFVVIADSFEEFINGLEK